MVKNSLAKLMMKIFSNLSKVEKINDTLIALIHKIGRVYNMKNFRSISFCNLAYKTVMKTFAQRLGHMMYKLVHLCQSSFISAFSEGFKLLHLAFVNDLLLFPKAKSSDLGKYLKVPILHKRTPNIPFSLLRTRLSSLVLIPLSEVKSNAKKEIDVVVWAGFQDGDFSFKTSYYLFSSVFPTPNEPTFKMI
ncbi:hypothetical protein CR513_08384, partial [Mucuna pruriens]